MSLVVSADVSGQDSGSPLDVPLLSMSSTEIQLEGVRSELLRGCCVLGRAISDLHPSDKPLSSPINLVFRLSASIIRLIVTALGMVRNEIFIT
ncbi:hypothetical protein PoB_006110400 [Plakobranchus ocellatus]|uniref:Uncharacterized protein n=1 Tax=Plakobranchus ocellatus TaxID=259542 RepID=A0AAV4CRV1_9GAST|nr:hypothetical protein PoB_006110400 [Plakobranchus ocellatus]